MWYWKKIDTFFVRPWKKFHLANQTYTKTLQSSKIIPGLSVQIFFYAIYKYFKKFYEVIKLAWKKLLYCCWGKWFTQSSSLMGKYFFKLNNKDKSIVHGHFFSDFIVYFELVFSQIFIWSPAISLKLSQGKFCGRGYFLNVTLGFNCTKTVSVIGLVLRIFKRFESNFFLHYQGIAFLCRHEVVFVDNFISLRNFASNVKSILAN